VFLYVTIPDINAQPISMYPFPALEPFLEGNLLEIAKSTTGSQYLAVTDETSARHVHEQQNNSRYIPAIAL
jgi:hypothetical protein